MPRGETRHRSARRRLRHRVLFSLTSQPPAVHPSPRPGLHADGQPHPSWAGNRGSDTRGLSPGFIPVAPRSDRPRGDVAPGSTSPTLDAAPRGRWVGRHSRSGQLGRRPGGRSWALGEAGSAASAQPRGARGACRVGGRGTQARRGRSPDGAQAWAHRCDTDGTPSEHFSRFTNLP